MISRLKGARLAFQVERVDIPLDALQARFASDEDRRLLAPAVTIPDLGAALQLAPIRELALKELISHARTGKVTIDLPVPELEQSLAVTTLKIGPGHRAVLEVAFTDGNIALVEAHGPIEPPIPLPLGLAAKGVYLGRDGSIFVDIPNFPDINLSLVGLGFRIPATVDGVLAIRSSADDSHNRLTAEGLRFGMNALEDSETCGVEFRLDGRWISEDLRRERSLEAGYDDYVGIEYEGGRLSEIEGVKATKRLLERVRDQLSK